MNIYTLYGSSEGLTWRNNILHHDIISRALIGAVKRRKYEQSIRITPFILNAAKLSPYLGHGHQVVAGIGGAESEHYRQSNTRAE